MNTNVSWDESSSSALLGHRVASSFLAMDELSYDRWEVTILEDAYGGVARVLLHWKETSDSYKHIIAQWDVREEGTGELITWRETSSPFAIAIKDAGMFADKELLSVMNRIIIGLQERGIIHENSPLLVWKPNNMLWHGDAYEVRLDHVYWFDWCEDPGLRIMQEYLRKQEPQLEDLSLLLGG